MCTNTVSFDADAENGTRITVVVNLNDEFEILGAEAFDRKTKEPFKMTKEFERNMQLYAGLMIDDALFKKSRREETKT